MEISVYFYIHETDWKHFWLRPIILPVLSKLGKYIDKYGVWIPEKDTTNIVLGNNQL